jgi:glycosyltransferase involved in cell wall biosynthesis
VATRIDVVMPARNVTSYLEDAVDSVFAQEDVLPSLVIVDDGSDKPVELPPKYSSDPRVTLIRSETRLNAGGARNLGSDIGDSDYLTFLDADDIWPANRSALLIKTLSASGADLALGQVRHFADRSMVELHVPPGLRSAYMAGGTMMPKATWQRVGPYNAELRTGEFIDWYTRFKALNLTESVINEITLNRRVHPRSTTATQRDDRSEYLKVVRAWMNRKG